MMTCREVAQDVWLGFARCPGAGARVSGQRWSCDREAADRAVAAVLEASGYRRDACATSRSHTRGVAVAVAAPAGVRVGVDLVELDRVGRRHAGAILSGEEWEALAPHAAVRPALAWALKEAAAKAVGDPLRCFPQGLRIAAGAGGLTLTALESEALELAAGWGLFERFLYAWVRSCHPERSEGAMAESWLLHFVQDDNGSFQDDNGSFQDDNGSFQDDDGSLRMTTARENATGP
jgi:phosphopantetheinyl transferase (holo-ACP synthase)